MAKGIGVEASGRNDGPVRCSPAPRSGGRPTRGARQPGAWLPEAALAASLLILVLAPDPLRRVAVLLFSLCGLAWASWRAGADSRSPGDWTRRDRW